MTIPFFVSRPRVRVSCTIDSRRASLRRVCSAAAFFRLASLHVILTRGDGSSRAAGAGGLAGASAGATRVTLDSDGGSAGGNSAGAAAVGGGADAGAGSGSGGLESGAGGGGEISSPSEGGSAGGKAGSSTMCRYCSTAAARIASILVEMRRFVRLCLDFLSLSYQKSENAIIKSQ